MFNVISSYKGGLMKINLLDCTLREAPIKDLILGKDVIQDFINGLEKTGINIIECGFLRDIGACQDNTIFKYASDIEPFLVNKNVNRIYTALIDYGRYNIDNLTDFDGKSIDALRICFKKNERNEVIPFAKAIKDKGYKIFIQQVDTLAYNDYEICELIQEINKLKPYAYSIVDTFGSMYADDVRHLCKLVNNNLDNSIIMGFHAHNNLMLAASNSELFIELMNNIREIIIDTAVLGCGRGAGNAATELLIQYINSKFNGEYMLDPIFDIVDNLMPKFIGKWGYNIPYFISGTHNTHVFNINYLVEKHNIKSKNLKNFVETLNEYQKKHYDYTKLEQLYQDFLIANIS